MVVVWPNPILLIILLFGGLETWRRWKERRSDDPATKAYYRVRPRTRLAVAAVYIGLIALLAVGMDVTFVERSLSDA
jgi:hypothetical protein